MKEIKVTIKLIVHSDDKDKELMDEAVEAQLQEMLDEKDLNYTYKVVEVEDEEEYDPFTDEGFL